MTRWEYKIEEAPHPVFTENRGDGLQAALNSFGRAGWEVINLMPGPGGSIYVFLKRPIEPGRVVPGAPNPLPPAFKPPEGKLVKERCRMWQEANGKAFPKSSCVQCGSILLPGWYCPLDKTA